MKFPSHSAAYHQVQGSDFSCGLSTRFSSQLTAQDQKKFQHLHFCQKGKPITKFRICPCLCFRTRHCGCLFKARIIQGIFFSFLEGCKMPFNVFGWRKTCLADKMLHENTCELSWVPLSPLLWGGETLRQTHIKANTLFSQSWGIL